MPKETPTTDWVSLREAATILGVHPATVRNWADRGELPSRRTPGGHRRFRRSDLVRWIESSQTPPPAEVQMLIQSALGRVRLHFSEDQTRSMPWMAGMDAAARAAMRQKGLQILEVLQGYLIETTDTAQVLDQVHRLGREYASFLVSFHLSLSDMMRGFLVFSDFLNEAALNIVEVVNTRTPSDWLAMLRRVRRFNNELLLGMTETYEQQRK